MSTSPQGWQDPKTDWKAADVVTPTALNRIEGNTQAIELGERTIDQGLANPSNTGTLRQILSWLAGRIKAITGEANWWLTTPAATLKALLGKFDPINGHKHTGEAGQGPALPGWELIDETTLASDAASISWSSLASAWEAFRIDIFGRASGSAVRDIYIRLNNVSTNTYDAQETSFDVASVNRVMKQEQTSIRMPYALPISTKQLQPISVHLLNLAGAYKPLWYQALIMDTGTEVLVGSYQYLVAGYWRNSSDAINRIDLIASADKIKAGSVFRLWGLTA